MDSQQYCLHFTCSNRDHFSPLNLFTSLEFPLRIAVSFWCSKEMHTILLKAKYIRKCIELFLKLNVKCKTILCLFF